MDNFYRHRDGRGKVFDVKKLKDSFNEHACQSLAEFVRSLEIIYKTVSKHLENKTEARRLDEVRVEAKRY